jgi:hypothetical protein
MTQVPASRPRDQPDYLTVPMTVPPASKGKEFPPFELFDQLFIENKLFSAQPAQDLERTDPGSSAPDDCS